MIQLIKIKIICLCSALRGGAALTRPLFVFADGEHGSNPLHHVFCLYYNSALWKSRPAWCHKGKTMGINHGGWTSSSHSFCESERPTVWLLLPSYCVSSSLQLEWSSSASSWPHARYQRWFFDHRYYKADTLLLLWTKIYIHVREIVQKAASRESFWFISKRYFSKTLDSKCLTSQWSQRHLSQWGR